MLLSVFAVMLFQTGVDAGPAQVSCDGSLVTLAATPINPPSNYLVEWEDGVAPGVFLVANPPQTTSYRVFLTDLDTLQVYEDTTRVLVHPTSADLFADGMFDELDWLVFFSNWRGDFITPELDPDGDGRISILDWFYLCNFNVQPENTPPSLTIEDVTTYQNETVIVPYIADDNEQTPQLIVAAQPFHGTALLLSGVLRYVPNPGFTGNDSFEVQVTDGYLTTPPETVEVLVLQPDTWSDLYDDIFFVWCKACHIDAVSGGLSLSTYALAQQGGVSGAGFIAGDPGSSPLYLRVANGSMPLGFDPLSFEDIERIRLWILRGAAP